MENELKELRKRIELLESKVNESKKVTNRLAIYGGKDSCIAQNIGFDILGDIENKEPKSKREKFLYEMNKEERDSYEAQCFYDEQLKLKERERLLELWDLRTPNKEEIKELYDLCSKHSNIDSLFISYEDAAPFSKLEVISRLIKATDYLLHKKNYDGPDYEEIETCLKIANKWM